MYFQEPAAQFGQNRSNLGLPSAQARGQAPTLEALGRRDAEQLANGGHDVHHADRGRDTARLGTRSADDERNTDDLLVEVFAVHAATVILKLLAMISDQDDHRVLGQAE